MLKRNPSWDVRTFPAFLVKLTMLCLLLTGCNDDTEPGSSTQPTVDLSPSFLPPDAGTADALPDSEFQDDAMAGDYSTDSDAFGESPPEQIWLETDLILSAGNVLDPKLGEGASLPLQYISEDDPGDTCYLEITGQAVNGRHSAPQSFEIGSEQIDIYWSALDIEGLPLDPGPVQLVASTFCNDLLAGWTDAIVHIVRLGIVSINFTSGSAGGNVPLAYHMLDKSVRGVTIISDETPEYLSSRQFSWELSDLDDDQGQARLEPEYWENTESPPWVESPPEHPEFGYFNIPAGFVAGSDYEITATIGSQATSAFSGIAVDVAGPEVSEHPRPAIRVVLDEHTPVLSDNWSPGSQIRLLADNSLPSWLGLHELTLTWRFESEGPLGWLPIPGHQDTHHLIYLLYGQTQVPDGTEIDASPAVSWIGVINDLVPAVQGLDADNLFGLMDALRENLYFDPYYIYDPGDSAYTSYEGSYIYWDYTWVDMTDWLSRFDGYRCYCHTVACLLSSSANHLGIDAEYMTLAENFDTHLTRAAGTEDWIAWSFNSHGVTGVRVDGERYVWDAAVDIDGDSNPDREPVEAVSPMGLPSADYLNLLTADPIGVVNDGKCFVY